MKFKKTISGLFDRSQSKALFKLYVSKGIPDGQFDNFPEVLQELTSEFNEITGLAVTSDLIRHFLMNARKCSDLPRVGFCKKQPIQRGLLPEPHMWKQIDLAYVAYGVSSDRLLTSRRHRDEFASILNATTGMIGSGHAWAATIVERRKLGLLPDMPTSHGPQGGGTSKPADDLAG